MAETEPFAVSNDLLEHPDQLQDRARRDGYLFFRGLIDADSILGLRRDFLEICHRHGWARGGERLMEGLRAGGPYVEGDDGYWPVLDEFQRLESFHAFAHHPAVLEMCDRLFGERTLAHPRNIGRIMFPENASYTTPAHQDFIHIRGTPETYTAWIPLGACPRDLGGLSVLAGSHQGGLYPVEPALGAGKVGIDTAPLEAEGLRWAAADFEIGDALFFHSHAVHKALPNRSSRPDPPLRGLPLPGMLAAGHRGIAAAPLQPHGLGRDLRRLEVEQASVLLERLRPDRPAPRNIDRGAGVGDAPMYRAARTRARPPQTVRWPRRVPLSRLKGGPTPSRTPEHRPRRGRRRRDDTMTGGDTMRRIFAALLAALPAMPPAPGNQPRPPSPAAASGAWSPPSRSCRACTPWSPGTSAARR